MKMLSRQKLADARFKQINYNFKSHYLLTDIHGAPLSAALSL